MVTRRVYGFRLPNSFVNANGLRSRKPPHQVFHGRRPHARKVARHGCHALEQDALPHARVREPPPAHVGEPSRRQARRVRAREEQSPALDERGREGRELGHVPPHAPPPLLAAPDAGAGRVKDHDVEPLAPLGQPRQPVEAWGVRARVPGVAYERCEMAARVNKNVTLRNSQSP